MKKWVYAVLLALISNAKAFNQSQLITNGDFDDASVTVGANFDTGFGKNLPVTNNIITNPTEFIGRSLGQGGDFLLCTDNISNYSNTYTDPTQYNSVARNKYLVVEPGKSTRTSRFTKQSAYRYVKAEVWRQTVNTLTFDEAYYFQLYATRMLPNEANAEDSRTRDPHELRVMAYWTIAGIQYEEEVFSIDLNKDLTYYKPQNNPAETYANQLKRFSNEYFVAKDDEITFAIELIYPVNVDGSPKSNVVLAIDDIAMGNFRDLLSLDKNLYCIDDRVSITPTSPPTNGKTYKIYRDGIEIESYTNAEYSEFQDYQLSTPGIYKFEVNANTNGMVLQSGSESIQIYDFSVICEVLDKPSIENTSISTIFTTEEVTETEFSFIENLKDATHFNWDFGDGNSSTSGIVNHDYVSGSTFNVYLTAYNQLPRCSIKNASPVVLSICDVANKPTMELSATLGTAKDVTMDITSASVNGSEYVWDFGDGTVKYKTNENNVSHTYADNGEYEICVTTKSNKCIIEACERVSFCLDYDVPQVVMDDCGNDFTFSVNADPGVTVKWYTPSDNESSRILLGTGTTLSRELVYFRGYTQVAGTGHLIAEIDNDCGIQTVVVPYANDVAPVSEILAVHIGSTVELYHTYEGSNTVDVDWEIKAYDGTNLVSTTPATGDGASYDLSEGITSIEVTLTLSYPNTNCETTVTRTICIPSENHDCCDGCTASN